MNKKNLIIIALVFFAIVTLFTFRNRSSKTKGSEPNNKGEITTVDEKDYLLEGYPIDTVPLIDLQKISSMKYFYTQNITWTNTSGFPHHLSEIKRITSLKFCLSARISLGKRNYMKSLLMVQVIFSQIRLLLI